MPHRIKIRTNLLTPISPTEFSLLPDHIITLEKTKIVDIIPASRGQAAEIDLRNCVAIPGLVDLHVHLSQYRIRGQYREALLPWLNDIVFPEEQKSADYEFAYNLAEDFFTALYKAGTTTAVIYTAPYITACESAFEAARLQNFRALIGMTLMNQNCPAPLIQETSRNIEDCQDLLVEYHNPEEGLQFILTPRFAPACSMELMRWVGDFAREHQLWIQTHLSENPEEINWVKQLFGLASYTEVYQKADLLTDKTLLAHCIHLSDEELDTIKSSGSKIVHCPDSNFFLHSGQMPLQRILDRDIPFALGSDVGAGTSLSMLFHAKMYNYRQTQTPVKPSDAFYRITLGAARILGMDNNIGSLEVGKEADLVLLKMPDPYKPINDSILSQIIFTGHDWNIHQVYSRGVRKV